jgi:hypothetical protein
MGQTYSRKISAMPTRSTNIWTPDICQAAIIALVEDYEVTKKMTTVQSSRKNENHQKCAILNAKRCTQHK